MNAVLPVPKYHQVYLVLREQLAEGRFGSGLPGEFELMRQFGVARVTIRRALEQLAAEGLISRERGRGTRALAPHEPQRRHDAHGAAGTTPLGGLLGHLVSASLGTGVQVLDVRQVKATHELAAVLDLAPGDPVQKAVRVRSTAEGPLSHITTWVPATLAGGLGRRALGRKPILVLLQESGLRLGAAQQAISARLADVQVAAHLGVQVGSALLAVRRLVRDADARPVLWLNGLYRPDRYEYQMHFSRVGDIDARVWVGDAPAPQFH